MFNSGNKTKVITVLVCFGVVAAVFVGVFLYKLSRGAGLAEADKCGPVLPDWLALDKKVAFSNIEIDSSGNRKLQSIREKLADLGARCENGEIYCGQGKKVVFYRVREFGMRPTPEMEQAKMEEEDRMRQLESDHTVIRIYHDKLPQ